MASRLTVVDPAALQHGEAVARIALYSDQLNAFACSALRRRWSESDRTYVYATNLRERIGTQRNDPG